MHYSKKLILQSNSLDSSAMSRPLKKEKEWENGTDWQRLKTTKFSMEVKVKVTQPSSTLCNSMDYRVHGILQARVLEWVAFPFSRWSSQPRDQTQVDSLPAEPQGKPKNTGVGSLSLLQGIFPTQESNQGLLHCRWIPCQLSYQGFWNKNKTLQGRCEIWISLVNSTVAIVVS